MKKGLSVLLIAAALFGFYGGATNLNDVLACKDYFTSASGASDDMQRLEDGLNQLKDNEQAYLDGQVALAEGEQTLADGYATLADGEAQYAAGLAAYKAAPGQLAEGEKSYSDLKKLISGLQTAEKHGVSRTSTHDTYWHDGFSHTVSDSVLAKIAAGEKTSDSPGLRQARAVITLTVKGQKDMLNTAAGLGGKGGLADQILAAKTYKQFDTAVVSGVEPLQKAAATLRALSKTASYAVTSKKDSFDKAKDVLALTKAQRSGVKTQLVTMKNDLASIEKDSRFDVNDETEIAELETIANQLPNMSRTKGKLQKIVAVVNSYHLGSTVEDAKENASAAIALYSNPKGTVAAGINAALTELGGASSLGMVKALDADLYDSLTTDLAILTLKKHVSDDVFLVYINQFATDMTKLATALEKSAELAESTAGTFSDWDDGYQTLADGQKQLASKSEGIPYAFKNMVTNSTIKAAVKKYDPSLMNILKKYAGNKGNMKLSGDMSDFDDDIVYLGNNVIPRALKVLAKVKASAESQLADGYKSYKEAPAKLADARQQLAEGRAQLADGEKQLAEGKEQLAVYEDGEQQVRDGLATLVGTEGMGGVQSIADRIGNDTDFDNGDNHLELDEGLAAVQAGKGYASDLTEAVTAEIMNRAIGTALLLGAGVLAVLAALLSFLKKNKGAGIFAILAAVAGCVGAVMGNSAGMTFSSIAGSTMGATPWIAAGILAAVAAVHAIVHFTAKKAA